MAKVQSRSADALLDPFPSDLPGAPEGDIASGSAMATEAARFWSHRMAAYASYFNKLGQCRNLVQLGALQLTFLQDMQQDYANEMAAFAATATLTGMPTFTREEPALAWRRAAPSAAAAPSTSSPSAGAPSISH